MSDADDITRNYHRGNVFSIRANENAAPGKQSKRTLILDFMIKHYPQGFTCDEVMVRLGVTAYHQTWSARYSELCKDMLIVPTGESRMTRSGSPAEVHRVVLFLT